MNPDAAPRPIPTGDAHSLRPASETTADLDRSGEPRAEPDVPNLPEPEGVVEASWSGRLLVVGATLMWSSNGLFAKADLFHDWPQESRGLLLAFYRALFAGLFLLPFIRRPKPRWEQLSLAVAFPFMSWSFLTSMTLTTAANTVWLQATSPVWVCLLGALLYGQQAVRRDVQPLVLGVLGAGVIVSCELWFNGGGPHGSLGVLWGLASGVTFAVVVLTMRRLRHDDAAWIVGTAQFCTALALAPVALTSGLWPSPAQWLALLGFGVIQMGLPYLLFVRGLRTVPSQEAAGLSLLEPVVGPIWVLLAWGERPQLWTLAGASLILAGLAQRYLPRRT